ncbi:MAG: hypothetical protein NTX38_00950 [Methylobacter sp.]|nr:hypothetical protein [Methylobacter sp.]
MEKHYLGYQRALRNNTQYTTSRNQALITRYYYLSEMKRLRFDDVVARLSNTFFVSESYVMKILGDSDAQFQVLVAEHPTRESLRVKWPEWEWS